jgi:hypothetical protein
MVVEHYGEVLAAARSAVRATKASHGKPRAARCIHATRQAALAQAAGIAVELIARDRR